jgi:hypothetical protein
MAALYLFSKQLSMMTHLNISACRSADCAPVCCLTLINKQFTAETMIRSFRCNETEKFFHRDFSRKFPDNIQERSPYHNFLFQGRSQADVILTDIHAFDFSTAAYCNGS